MHGKSSCIPLFCLCYKRLCLLACLKHYMNNLSFQAISAASEINVCVVAEAFADDSLGCDAHGAFVI